jgi:YfiH family protein
MPTPADFIEPDWPAPKRVRALMTTRYMGDLAGEPARARLRALLPADPAWLHQVHGTRVLRAEAVRAAPQADGAVARTAGAVCAVKAADCMPVLLCDEAASVVAAAHAGWRGLCAGVLEAAVAATEASPAKLMAWLGPAIGPRVYEVGAEVREQFLAHDAAAETAFSATRPGHWLLDLYAVARQRLAGLGVTRIHGGDFCTHSDATRFYSFRRDRTRERMAALIWLA